MSSDLQERLEADITAAGGELVVSAGTLGVTMFDLPGSEDQTVTVLLSSDHLQKMPSQALVRIRSRPDGRNYLGMVTAGPFAEPDSLKADSAMLKTLLARGGNYLPPHHGWVRVSLLGEELADGTLCPPRLRPLPHSQVTPLSDEDSAKVLKATGDIRLGLVVGYEKVIVGVPSQAKDVLPRHTAVLGTTGGGKSTTVARLVEQAQAAGLAVILLDVEGEYTHLHEPTTNKKMLAALADRGLEAQGVPADRMTIYHLVGRESANPEHPHRVPFSLQFARLSPYAASEILGLTEPQVHRYFVAYDIAKEMTRELGMFPIPGSKDFEAQERMAIEIDEFERGYPRMTLDLLHDVVMACHDSIAKDKEDKSGKGEERVQRRFKTLQLNEKPGREILNRKIHASGKLDSGQSWRALLGKLGRLQRLKVFDAEAKAMNYAKLLQPGTVNILDLSDSGMSELNNLTIADLLTGVQEAQDKAYVNYEQAKKSGQAAATPTRTLVIIEEAHEFLSEERIDKMKILFEQVAKIAKRGRKRWLGLVFVTQLPQHLPRQVFGLVNSYILHKIMDPHIVSTLRKTVSGIDESLWNRLSGLAPGQAIVSLPHMARPLLVAIDPAPAELRLVD